MARQGIPIRVRRPVTSGSDAGEAERVLVREDAAVGEDQAVAAGSPPAQLAHHCRQGLVGAGVSVGFG